MLHYPARNIDYNRQFVWSKEGVPSLNFRTIDQNPSIRTQTPSMSKNGEILLHHLKKAEIFVIVINYNFEDVICNCNQLHFTSNWLKSDCLYALNSTTCISEFYITTVNFNIITATEKATIDWCFIVATSLKFLLGKCSFNSRTYICIE